MEEEGTRPVTAPPTISLVPKSGPGVAGGGKSALDRPVEGHSLPAWMARVRPKINNVPGKNFILNVTGTTFLFDILFYYMKYWHIYFQRIYCLIINLLFSNDFDLYNFIPI